MDRLHEMEAFIAVADAGSFVKGAARLRVSPPAVTRAIASLEERLGAQIFTRTTRALKLTEIGVRYLESARRLLAEMEVAEKDALGEATIPGGHLAVTAPVTFGRSALAPLVCAFLDAHPKVTASVSLLDRVVNLVEEGFDVAIRIGALPDSNLVARKVGEVRRLLVASPEYLAKHRCPKLPADLKHHAIIAFTGLMPNREWRFVDGKRNGQVIFAPRLEINDAVATMAAAERGEGITIALSYMVAKQIKEGRLIPLLVSFTPPALPVHIVYPQSRLVAPKVRAFVDFAGPRLKNALERFAIAPGGPGPKH